MYLTNPHPSLSVNSFLNNSIRNIEETTTKTAMTSSAREIRTALRKEKMQRKKDAAEQAAIPSAGMSTIHPTQAMLLIQIIMTQIKTLI